MCVTGIELIFELRGCDTRVMYPTIDPQSRNVAMSNQAQTRASKANRSLFRSPFSSSQSQKGSKKKSAEETAIEAEKTASSTQGMHGNDPVKEKSDPIADTASIHEIVIQRMNETLQDFRNTNGDFDNPMLKQVIPAIATAVSVAVGEVLSKILRKIDERFDNPRPTVNE